MNKVTYVYNHKTCQYEPARISIREAAVYLLSLVAMSFALFIGMVLLYNYFSESDTEKTLRAENNAIEEYKPVLEQKLAVIQSTLAQLDERDRVLYEQLFNAPPPTEAHNDGVLPKNKVLLATTSEFGAYLEKLEIRSKALAGSDHQTARKLNLDEDDIAILVASPSTSPIDGLTDEHLISGFGDRVNPFHKGTYHHAGVDLNFPRGTSVVATGKGVVTIVKRSELQAGYGNWVEIDHGLGFVTRYAHLDDITVRIGQKVEKGTPLGTVGNSGGSIAPHLHYEILVKGEQVNPIVYMIEDVSPGQYSAMLQKSNEQNQSLD